MKQNIKTEYQEAGDAKAGMLDSYNATRSHAVRIVLLEAARLLEIIQNQIEVNESQMAAQLREG